VQVNTDVSKDLFDSTERLKAACPLRGRTVMITRALAQTEEFASELEAFGARVHLSPMIEIVPPASYADLDRAIENLNEYDWLIFTSVNGVDYFLKRLTEHGEDTSRLDDLRVCAIGEATANHLASARVHTDVVPLKFKAEGVLAALESFLGGSEKFRGLKFLIPRASEAREFLPDALRKSGAIVDAVAAYKTVSPRDLNRGRIEALILGGAIDCVTFTSASTIKNLARLFNTNDLSGLLEGIAVACIGDVTTETAARFNLRVDIQPFEFTTAALAFAIADFYARQKV
jgi:uroporphyrinogen III methyltransferase / synthase